MVLPNKYISVEESFIGLGALIIDIIGEKQYYIDKLWSLFLKKYLTKDKLPNFPSYQKFILTVEFLYTVNMVSSNEKGEIYNENFKSENTISR